MDDCKIFARHVLPYYDMYYLTATALPITQRLTPDWMLFCGTSSQDTVKGGTVSAPYTEVKTGNRHMLQDVGNAFYTFYVNHTKNDFHVIFNSLGLIFTE